MVSPFNERMKELTKGYRDVSGWESPMYYGNYEVVSSFGNENYKQDWKSEHQACRENVGVFDMSFMSKYTVKGRNCGNFLNAISTANVNGPCGKITYTQWLDAKGMVMADLTVTKVNDFEFMVVATDTQRRQVMRHFERALDSMNETECVITDVTDAYGMLSIQGPNSRKLLQGCTDTDLSNEAYEFRDARDIYIGYAKCKCARITYVGELGYELYVPASQCLYVYDYLTRAGKDEGIEFRNCGLKALGSLRIEKGYLDYGHDVDNEDHVCDVGLSFTCDLKKPGGFVGIDKVREVKEFNKSRGGPLRSIASVFIDGDSFRLHGGEIISRNGAVVGDVRTASYGFTVGGSVGIAMIEPNNPDVKVNRKYIEEGDWRIEGGEGNVDVKVVKGALFDPKGCNIKK